MSIASVEPVTVTIRSGTDPSEMWIFAPDSSRILLMISPPLPMIEPTSFPLMIMRIVKVTLGMSLGKGLSIPLSEADILVKEVFDKKDWKAWSSDLRIEEKVVRGRAAF